MINHKGSNAPQASILGRFTQLRNILSSISWNPMVRTKAQLGPLGTENGNPGRIEAPLPLLTSPSILYPTLPPSCALFSCTELVISTPKLFLPHFLPTPCTIANLFSLSHFKFLNGQLH